MENFFTFADRASHEIGSHCEISLAENLAIYERWLPFVGREGAVPMLFRWHRIDALPSIIIKPDILPDAPRSILEQTPQLIDREC